MNFLRGLWGRLLDSTFLRGDPVARAWVLYVGMGTIGVGLLSIPSYGPPTALIPMFFGSALLLAVGVAKNSRRISVAGLGLASIASWARAVALFGVDQHGAGSSILATFVWVWIAIGALMLAAAVITRGLE